MDRDARTEHQLHDLVAATRREDAARVRRAARWQARAAIAEVSVAALLAAAHRDGRSVALEVRGLGLLRALEVLAVGDDYVAAREPAGTEVLVALHAVEAVELHGLVATDVGGGGTATDRGARELGRQLLDALDALAPLAVEVVTTSGRSVRGRLTGIGEGVLLLTLAGGVRAVAARSVGAVRIGAHEGADGAGQPSSPPLSPLPTTSG